MTCIIAGMFANRGAASAAVSELRGAGVKNADIDAFVVPTSARSGKWHLGRVWNDDDGDDGTAREIGPLSGAAVGGAIGAVAGLVATPLIGPMAIAGGFAAGAYAGSLAGVMRSLGEPRELDVNPVRRPAGVMVAVHVGVQEAEDVAFDVLRHNGAHSIEWAEGAWRHGKWASFDPVAVPQRIVSLDRNRSPRRRTRPRVDAPGTLAAPDERHLARHHGHK